MQAYDSPKIGARLFFAGVAQFRDDFLPHHLSAVIKHLNQTGAGGARIGNNRSELSGGKQANDLPLVLGGLDPQLVLLPLGHQ